MDRPKLAVAAMAVAFTISLLAGSGLRSEAAVALKRQSGAKEKPTFQASRAWDDLVKQVAFGPRVPGTEAQLKCRDWMVSELKQSCDDVRLQELSHKWSVNQKTLKMWNVLAFQNWKDAKVRVAIIAHWDSRAEADQDPNPVRARQPIPGANDGASGVAIILELARVLKQTQPQVGIEYVLTDGEDLGPSEEEMYLGAIEYANHQPMPKATYGILLDMLGKKNLRVPMEPNSIQIAGNLEYALYRHASEVGLASTFPMVEGPQIDDDHLPISKAGLPTIDLIDFDYAPYWHTIDDTPDKCSPESLGKVGKLLQTWLEKRPAFDPKK